MVLSARITSRIACLYLIRNRGESKSTAIVSREDCEQLRQSLDIRPTYVIQSAFLPDGRVLKCSFDKNRISRLNRSRSRAIPGRAVRLWNIPNHSSRCSPDMAVLRANCASYARSLSIGHKSPTSF